MLTTVLPRGRSQGGEIATQAFVDALRAVDPGLRVHGYERPGPQPPKVPWEVVVGRRPIETAAAPRLRTWSWMAQALVSGRPYSAQKYVSTAYRRAAAGLRGAGARLVILDHAQVGWLAGHLGGLPYVYVAHNVESEVYRSQAAAAAGAATRWGHAREARLWACVEHELVRGARMVWTLTARDAERLAREAPEVPVTAFALPPAPVEPVAAAGAPAFDVALLGTWTWEANAVGLRWFADEVVPRLPEGLDVLVAGLGGAQALAGRSGLRAVGRVPDAAAFLRSARVVAVPTMAGGGIQVKALDAIALGVPVVTTTRGVRGIGALPAHVRTAHGPDAFAASVRAALSAPADPAAPAVAAAWARGRREDFVAAVAEATARARRAQGPRNGASTRWTSAADARRS